MSEHTHQSSEHGAAEHPAWLAHHFESAEQQFYSGKLGMWIFLLTEILFFSGLFCAYIVYRANSPQVFVDGHYLLDTTLGAVNTIVLILSSLTMAWAVRCTQLGNRIGAIRCLIITLICAAGFLGIKSYEYHHKWEHGLFPGQERIAYFLGLDAPAESTATTPNAAQTAEPTVPDRTFTPDEDYIHEHVVKPQGEQELGIGMKQHVHNVRTFVGIYFGMTGLHAIHVIAGMIAISWILRRTIRNDFNPRYFGPVDYVGLYWHLVDLIWIYLFPLLYLIR